MGLLERLPRTPRIRGYSERRRPGAKGGPARSGLAKSPPPQIPRGMPGGGLPCPTTQPLPPSIADAEAAPQADQLAIAFHWKPVQVREHEQRTESSYTTGTYVDTLSMGVLNKTFADAPSHMIRVEVGSFRVQDPCWCYVVGGSFVCCKGVVVGVCPREHDPENGRNMRVARLPANARPERPLQFAALAREVYDVGGHAAYSSYLVTLIVTPDGWISGVSAKETEAAIDLSALRFCTGRGVSLVDQVSLHTVDINGTRMATLQGTLGDRFFAVHCAKPLALLPESVQPPRDMAFVVAGHAPGGFHLVSVQPSFGLGVGAELVWRDSTWNHDQIHFTGVMFEVSEHALSCSTLDSSWTGESLKIFVHDFQSFLIRKFGSVEAAWHRAFDTDGSGSIDFTEFGLGCKAAGYVGNATRLWAALDTDRSGEISLSELYTGLDEGDELDATRPLALPGMVH